MAGEGDGNKGRNSGLFWNKPGSEFPIKPNFWCRTEHSGRIANASALAPQYLTLKGHKNTVRGVLDGSKDVGFTKHALCRKKYLASQFCNIHYRLNLKCTSV